MPRQTTEAFFDCPPEKVWRAVTEPSLWGWRSDLRRVRSTRDGRQLITQDEDGVATVFRITAFAPYRWYAAELESRDAEGSCQALFFAEGGGTRVEFTADIHGKTAKQKLLLRLQLGKRQRRYIEDLKREMGVS